MVASSTGGFDKTVLDRPLGDVASFWMLTVTAANFVRLLRGLSNHHKSAKMALTTVNANHNFNPNAKQLCPNPNQLILQFNLDFFLITITQTFS